MKIINLGHNLEGLNNLQCIWPGLQKPCGRRSNCLPTKKDKRAPLKKG